MKSKSFIVALLAISTLGLTTSCEDMFDIESTRVVYDHELNSTSDSTYTTLGVLQCLRKVADRYVILGEVRGDMIEINEHTKTSLRNLANFNFEEDNEYLNVRDYYAIINNCNYALANMDDSLAINNQLVMMDEYVAFLGIRAWTYLQLAINHGTVPFYTEPITTMGDLDKEQEMLDVKGIAERLIPELLQYLDVELPTFVGTRNGYPVLRLVVADLYLWSGNYAEAVKYYGDYLTKNRKFICSPTGVSFNFPGMLSLGGLYSKWNGEKGKDSEVTLVSSETYGVTGKSDVGGYENLAYILNAGGIGSELPGFFLSGDNTHYLNLSTYWSELSEQQNVFFLSADGKTFKSSVEEGAAVGDMRNLRYINNRIDETNDGESYTTFSKFGGGHVNIYRRSITYLRYAEAMNALALEMNTRGKELNDSTVLADSRTLANNAFYLLKDAYQVFFPKGSEERALVEEDYEKEMQQYFIGVHARGCGDVYNDSVYYVLTPAAISKRLGVADSLVAFCDTIRYIDELIIDELALESTLEGNRFGDLIRFSKRRQAWGDENYQDFLAKRVASRAGAESFDASDSLYVKLSTSEKYWYLPFK